MFKNYSRVRLVTNNYENKGVSEGAVGYIIETYDDGAYEVEFSDTGGTTIALIALEKYELEPAELSKTALDREAIEETMYLLRSPANATQLRASIAEFEAGNYKIRDIIDDDRMD